MANHPMQPLERDEAGVIRFKRNKIVEWLLSTGPLDLNAIAAKVMAGQYSKDDYTQLMQLIGYSVSGFGNLSDYVRKEAIRQADRKAAKL